MLMKKAAPSAVKGVVSTGARSLSRPNLAEVEQLASSIRNAELGLDAARTPTRASMSNLADLRQQLGKSIGPNARDPEVQRIIRESKRNIGN